MVPPNHSAGHHGDGARSSRRVLLLLLGDEDAAALVQIERLAVALPDQLDARIEAGAELTFTLSEDVLLHGRVDLAGQILVLGSQLGGEGEKERECAAGSLQVSFSVL